jgi:hypothetical protein
MSLCSLHIQCVWKRGIQDLDVLSVYQENAINDEFQIILRGTLGLSRPTFRKCTLQALRWEPNDSAAVFCNADRFTEDLPEYL